MRIDHSPRILNDALLGPIDLNALEAKLNTVSDQLAMVPRFSSVDHRVLHFQNNGRQLYESAKSLFGNKPEAERLAAIARCNTGQQIMLPPGVSIVAEGAHLCLVTKH